MFRVTELWHQRQARRARINQRLAEADAADRMEWVQRGIPTQPDPDAQRAKLEDGLAEPGTWEAS